VIYLYMSGGMSHLDTFDPKPGNEAMGPTRTIGTNADGIQISEYLPQMAKQMDKVAVINSMASTQGAHKQGNYFMHTSYELRSSIRHPAMGAWLLKFEGKRNATLPGNVMIGNDSNHPGAGFFESNLAPLMISDPAGGLQNSSLRRGLTEEKFNFHVDLAQKLDAGFIGKYDQRNVRAYTDMYGDAIRLMRSRDLVAFDISKESDSLRDRYGDNPFGQGCLLARRLAEHDVRFVEVTFGSWDTHNGNFVEVPEKAEVLDRALSALLDDLSRRGMLEETLVVLATEFGRTPEINQNEGRDHHPQAFTCLMSGGGVRGGRLWGKTDERGANVTEDKVSVPDLNATIAYALGLPLDQVLYSPSKRPFTVADKGKPVAGLFA
ncbi:MAG: DUF1501 domain-containing protein, partial [Verrucomicrobiae bacterium]|nr:DUF1501 domain-containing protein [Verrucomicrobiae bacterium]